MSKLYARAKDQSFARYQLNLDGSYTQFGEDTSVGLEFSTWDDTFGLMMNYMFGFAYNRQFGMHKIDADLKYMQSSQSVVGDNPDYRNQGVFGRGTYNFDKRYTAEFGFAYKRSQNYADNNRFGFFPSLSAAWIVSNEAFMQDASAIDFLKVRASIGKVGNSNIGIGYRYPFEEKFNSGSGYYFGESGTDGAYEGRIANANLTWEESLNANVGVEVSLLKSLQLEADLFRHDRSQIITGLWNTLPSVIGQDLPYANNGSVLTQGFELTATHRKSVGGFNYLIKGTVSYTSNEVTYMDEVNGLNSWEYRTGQQVAQQWGLEVAEGNFFNNQTEIDAWAKSSYGTVQPGDVKYVDQNNDNIIDAQDYVPMGSPSIPQLNYGLTLGFDFKGFDFNVLFTGVANRSLFINNNVFWGLQNNNNITTEVAENSWGISQNPLYPRLTTQINNHNYQASSLWLKDVGYFRIQTLEIGYTLPQAWMGKANINNLRIFANGYNLFSFDNLRKYNVSAEIPNAGVTLYPEIKVTNIGVSLNF